MSKAPNVVIGIASLQSCDINFAVSLAGMCAMNVVHRIGFSLYPINVNLTGGDEPERIEMQQKHAARNKAAILDLARQLGVQLASHDDATAAHVEEAVADGVAIAEFPTTREAAEAAHTKGLAVLMGAPNVVRGGSHSGNISATDVAVNGHLDVLSSDYVPASLLAAVFALPERIEGFGLPDAVRLVTANPAKAASLHDRGEIAEGKRADLVQVCFDTGHPVVRRVWRAGQRVM